MSTVKKTTDTILLGTAYRTINPPEGLCLRGYPNSDKRQNTGVALDLCARAAVFGSVQSKTPQAAIVVLDTIAVTAQLVKAIRQAASEQIPGLPIEAIMVAATHTHSAPTLSTRMFGQDDELAKAYVDKTIQDAAAALVGAWKQPAEVRLRVGRTEVRLGHNRRVVDPEGHATNDWFDAEGKHTGFFNPTVRILAFDDAKTKKPRCVMEFYGMHPVTLGGHNPKVSADYPGYFCRAVEAALPGCMAIHLTSGAANINPRVALSPDHLQAKPPGETLAKAVLDELPHARPTNATPIGVHSEYPKFILSDDAQKNWSGRAQDSLDGKTLNSEIQVIRLGDVALVSSPGELFGEIALTIENTSPFPTTCVVSCANDVLGYLVTDTARREGGYESQNIISDQIEQPILQTSRKALYQARAS